MILPANISYYKRHSLAAVHYVLDQKRVKGRRKRLSLCFLTPLSHSYIQACGTLATESTAGGFVDKFSQTHL